MLILLPVAILLARFAPWAVTPLLMIGGSYLAFEATEKILEVVMGDHHSAVELIETDTPQELEKRQVSGAIRTDFILSAEIMAIALNELGDMSIGLKSAALALVAVAITVAVYGVVAIIVKLDDIGLHMAERRRETTRRIGRFLVRSVPGLLKSLATIGTAAMLWVGGGILLHGIEDLGFTTMPHAVHDLAEEIARGFGRLDRSRLLAGQRHRRVDPRHAHRRDHRHHRPPVHQAPRRVDRRLTDALAARLCRRRIWEQLARHAVGRATLPMRSGRDFPGGR